MQSASQPQADQRKRGFRQNRAHAISFGRAAQAWTGEREAMRSTENHRPHGIHRRSVLQMFGLGFAATALPNSSRAAETPAAPPGTSSPAVRANVLTKPIPRTDRSLPVVGLGTFLAFDVLPGQKRAHLAEVFRRFWEGGGRVVDTSPLYGTGEISVGDFASAMGIGGDLFIANKVWSTGDFLADDSHAARSLEQSQERLWREKFDLMQCHSLVNVDIIVPLLRAWKKEGRIGLVGVTHHEPAYFDPLADWVEKQDIDFVQVHYSIFERRAEERILPAALKRGIGVLVNMPFEKARLFKIVENREVPGFAREAGIDTWAQYFLKWVVSHPAVTCAIPATSNPGHLSENLGAMQGELPDERLRNRMAEHMRTIPGFEKLGEMPWYPEKKYPGLIARAQQALRAR